MYVFTYYFTTNFFFQYFIARITGIMYMHTYIRYLYIDTVVSNIQYIYNYIHAYHYNHDYQEQVDIHNYIHIGSLSQLYCLCLPSLYRRIHIHHCQQDTHQYLHMYIIFANNFLTIRYYDQPVQVVPFEYNM